MSRHEDSPLLHNPEMNRLVEELNRQRGIPPSDDHPSPSRRDPSPSEVTRFGDSPAPMLRGAGSTFSRVTSTEVELPAHHHEAGVSERGERRVSATSELGRLLVSMVEHGASDLLLIRECPVTIRVDGELQSLSETDRGPRSDLLDIFAPHLGRPHRQALDQRGAADLTLSLQISSASPDVPGNGGSSGPARFRFRVNLHRQRGQLAAAVRCLPQQIPSLEELHLPPSLLDLAQVRQGLVLFCGPTGAGKSSTQAALVHEINRTRRCHVITIEQPIEYEHEQRGSLIEHVEVGFDAPSFAEALRSSLRQDPDVILVGEMRDLETIATAVTAAETGHLVFGTLHTHDAVQAIHRIVDVFPDGSRDFLRHQLAMSLNAILSQQLVPRRASKGRVPACELLRATHAVRSHIRSGHLQKIYNEIVLGQRHGMVTLEASLASLVKRGWIDVEEARLRSRRPEELESLLAS